MISEAGAGIVVTSRSFGSGDADPEGMLREAGLEVVRADPGHDPEKLGESLSRAVAWIAGAAPVDDRHLSLAPNLKVLARYGVGCDAVDLKAAARLGVVVTNTPGANVEAVADHAVALMLACLRRLLGGDRAVRRSEYPSLRGRELGALTVGLVGFGRIGRAVARRLLGGFGSRVIVHDPFVASRRVEEAGAEPVGTLVDLARTADIVSLHLPGGSGTIVDAVLLGQMRRGVVLVNTARGDLIDEGAVADALAEGQLSAAGLDVLAASPASGSPLLRAPNVLLTPHVAAQTVQAIDKMGMMAAAEVIRVVGGEEPINRVNNLGEDEGG